MGGVLHIVSRQPGDEPHFRASAGVASRDGYQFKASGGGPLVDNLLYGAVTAVANDAPGRLDNVATGASHVGGASANAPRGCGWRPPAVRELGLAVSGECTCASQDAYVPFDDLHASHAYTAPGMPASLADFYQKRCGNSASRLLRPAATTSTAGRLNAVAAWQVLHYTATTPSAPATPASPSAGASRCRSCACPPPASAPSTACWACIASESPNRVGGVQPDAGADAAGHAPVRLAQHQRIARRLCRRHLARH